MFLYLYFANVSEFPIKRMCFLRATVPTVYYLIYLHFLRWIEYRVSLTAFAVAIATIVATIAI